MIFDFIQAFNDKVRDLQIDWEVKGLISSNGKIFTLGSDSKLIGRIFELISAPIIQEVAEENGYLLEVSQSQTVYPDFTLRKKDSQKDMIAVDVKTTYRRYNKKGQVQNYGYTLGSYASFMRNGTKNIAYPYSDYSKHYIVGFVYDRTEDAKEDVTDVENINSIMTPYSNVEFFVQEKYKIAGERAGSGNTENIGTVPTNNTSMFVEGNGPFAFLGQEVFEHYWRNYPKFREVKPKFKNISEYFEWLNSEGYVNEKKEKIYKEWKKRFK